MENKKENKLLAFTLFSFILNGLSVGVYPLLVLLQEYSPLLSYVLSYVGEFFASMLHILFFAFCIVEQRKGAYKGVAIYASVYAALSFLKLFSLSVIEYSYMLDIKEIWGVILFTTASNALIELAFSLIPIIICALALKTKKAYSLNSDGKIAFSSIVGAGVFFLISVIELTVNVVSFIKNEALGIVYTSEVYSIILDYANLLVILLISVLFASFIQRRLEK